MNGSNTQPIVVVRGASKQYGSHWALQRIDLELAPGEILGFIGPNGAGKTTLMKILAGLSCATSGEVCVLGCKLDRETRHVPPGIGVMFDASGLIPHLSGRKNLELIARIQNILSSGEIDAALRRVGLDPADRRSVSSYSLGMQQRLRLALAIMERPMLLLLDEPANGLDPLGVIELRAILEAEARRGAAILMASHFLAEVERVCHRVVLVHRGRVLKEIIPARLAGAIMVRVSGESDVARLGELAAGRHLGLRRVGDTEGHPRFQVEPTDVPSFVQSLAGAGVRLEEITRARRSLEEEFVDANVA